MWLSLLAMLPGLTAYAQTAEDALLFSGSNVNGTARYQGLGGAQTALGADIGSISGNPAGLGFFRKSEWSITPGFGYASTNSSYLGNSISDSKSNLNVANIGLVFANPKDDIIGGKWRGGSFGISFSRMNSFQNQFSYEGTNNVNSITDAFTDQANGIPLIDFIDDRAQADLQVAYLTYLINPRSDNDDETQYFSSVGADPDTEEPFPVNQRATVEYTGARNQWNLSYGGNYDNKLYFGASLGISSIRYGISNTYQETVLAPREELILDNFTLSEDIDVRGTGINFSAGIIYKPNDVLRFGVSAITPTFYRLTDEYTPRIQANFEYTESLGENIPFGLDESITNVEPFEYRLTTPFSASAGVAVFAGKNGFVSADVTYSSFNTMRLRDSNGDDFQGENDFVESNYQPALTARIGGEFRKDIFRLRAGFNYQGEAYKNRVDNLDRTRLNLTAGVGIRLPAFYVDVAIVHSRFDSGYTPYTISTQSTPSVITNNRLTNAVISFGTFF